MKTFSEFVKQYSKPIEESYLAGQAVKKLLNAKRSLDAHSNIPSAERALDHTVVHSKLKATYDEAKADHARLTS